MHRRLPVAALVAVPCIIWTFYLVVAVDSRPDNPEVLAAIRAIAATLTIVALLLWAGQQIAARLDAGFDRLRAEFRHELGLHDAHMVNSSSAMVRTMTAIEHAVAATSVRRVGLASVTAEQRVITTAVIEEDTDKLPGYAAGYADGLARKPMVDGNVVPLNGTKH